jgi:hypothetical protein
MNRQSFGYVSFAVARRDGSRSHRLLHWRPDCTMLEGRPTGDPFRVAVRGSRWRIPERLLSQNQGTRWRPGRWCTRCLPQEPPGEWQDRSLCNPDHWPDLPFLLDLGDLLTEHPDGPDPAWWFLTDPGGTYRPAKAICDVCPVQQDCLSFAVDNNEPDGMWGGLSPRQRKHLKETAA